MEFTAIGTCCCLNLLLMELLLLELIAVGTCCGWNYCCWIILLLELAAVRTTTDGITAVGTYCCCNYRCWNLPMSIQQQKPRLLSGFRITYIYVSEVWTRAKIFKHRDIVKRKSCMHIFVTFEILKIFMTEGLSFTKIYYRCMVH